MSEQLFTTEEQRDLLIQQWLEAKAAAEIAKPVIEAEMVARKKLFDFLYTSPKEGVNKLDLGDGYSIKGTYKLERKIDKALLNVVLAELRETCVNTDILIELKPELKVAAYRTLTAEQMQIMDKALIIKPSTPTLELVEPKAKG